jgi:hypothetical protein
MFHEFILLSRTSEFCNFWQVIYYTIFAIRLMGRVEIENRVILIKEKHPLNGPNSSFWIFICRFKVDSFYVFRFLQPRSNECKYIPFRHKALRVLGIEAKVLLSTFEPLLYIKSECSFSREVFSFAGNPSPIIRLIFFVGRSETFLTQNGASGGGGGGRGKA